jgi:hypothetical protein
VHRWTREGPSKFGLFGVLWLERGRGWGGKRHLPSHLFLSSSTFRPARARDATKYVKYVKLPPLLVVRIRGPRPIDGNDPLPHYCLDVWMSGLIHSRPKRPTSHWKGLALYQPFPAAFFPIAAGGPFTCHHLRAKCGILQLWLTVAGRSLRGTITVEPCSLTVLRTEDGAPLV